MTSYHRLLHHSLWAVCCTFLSKLPKNKCRLNLPARAQSFLNEKTQYITQDIGCGMMAVRTTLTANQLPDSLKNLRTAIEQAVPHGRTHQVCNLWCRKWYCEIIYCRKYQEKLTNIYFLMRVRKNNKSRLQQSVARTVRVTGHCCMLLPVFLHKWSLLLGVWFAT